MGFLSSIHNRIFGSNRHEASNRSDQIGGNASATNSAIERLNEINEKALKRREEFFNDNRSYAEKFEDFLHLKHQVPFIGFVPCVAGSIEFTMFHANDDIVAWEYFWFGKDGYETDIVSTWLEWCKEPSVVLDIGGYSGLMSILAAKSHPETMVHMFEPMDRTVERAKINLKANSVYNRTTLYNKAASNAAGQATINLPREENFLGTGNSLVRTGAKVVDQKQIECVRVDDVLPQADPDIIKIDVEGHELACLEGMTEMLKRSKPKMIVEIWQPTRKEVLEKLEELGYICEPFEPEERRVMNYRCLPA